VLIKRQVRHQRFQLLVLVFQLSQPRQLRDPHARYPPLPLVEGLFCDPQLATDFRHWCSALRLPHRVEHLLRREVLPHPPSCCPENRFHKAGNTNISLVQFFGDVSLCEAVLWTAGGRDEEELHVGANALHGAPGRRWYTSGRSMSQGGDHRTNLLQVEAAASGHGDRGAESAATVGRRKQEAESIKILAGTDLPQVKDALYKNKPLPENCPSKASLGVFILRGIRGRVEELTELLDMLEKKI
jgi:hypothetical protein